MLDNLLLGLMAALQWKQFLFMILGTVIGLWVGVLPGLGGPVAMAILIPFTFTMDPLSALLMLASISVGAAFGGSVTSILLNIPGEASSAATAYDGYPMAQQGKAKVAMGLSAGASMVAGIVGVLILMFAAEPVAKAALAFGPAENFALAVLGLTVVAVASLGSTLKGLAMGALGISISLIGVDSFSEWSATRSAASICSMASASCRSMVGLFAITELTTHDHRRRHGRQGRQARRLAVGRLLGHLQISVRADPEHAVRRFHRGHSGTWRDGREFPRLQRRHAHLQASRAFGKGAPEGVIAPEASNNSCIPTSLIPALTLGIPGGATAAILLVAVTLQGLRPGPMLFTSNPELIWGFYMGLLIGAIMATILYLMMIPWFAMITLVRIELMAPMLLIITLFGAYANERSMMDVFVAIGVRPVRLFRQAARLSADQPGDRTDPRQARRRLVSPGAADFRSRLFGVRAAPAVGGDLRHLPCAGVVAGREEAHRQRRRRSHVTLKEGQGMEASEIKKLLDAKLSRERAQGIADRAGQGAEPADRPAGRGAAAQGVHQDGDRAAAARDGLCRRPLRRHGQSDCDIWRRARAASR